MDIRWRGPLFVAIILALPGVCVPVFSSDGVRAATTVSALAPATTIAVASSPSDNPPSTSVGDAPAISDALQTTSANATATLQTTSADATATLQATPADATATLQTLLDQAESLAPLETVIVAQHGDVLAERGYRDHSTTAPTNIKSASKVVMSALVGIAIDKQLLEGTEQRVAALLQADLPADPDPRMQQLTIGHLLSMQAGLESTSGAGYGGWVASQNWVRAALARPFVDVPGGRMIYSTGSTHLLSAILTRVSGRSTLQLSRDWLGGLEDFRITSWIRDPQGIYMGGNQMAMSPRSLLALGELYRRGGISPSGQRLISQAWIDASWQMRTTSPWTGDGQGYAWFLTQIAGEQVRYGWGYGGQMLYVVPRLGLTVVMTSDERASSARTGHRDDLHRLLGSIMAVLQHSEAPVSGAPAAQCCA